jgi:hypothetical protein
LIVNRVENLLYRRVQQEGFLNLEALKKRVKCNANVIYPEEQDGKKKVIGKKEKRRGKKGNCWKIEIQ